MEPSARIGDPEESWLFGHSKLDHNRFDDALSKSRTPTFTRQ